MLALLQGTVAGDKALAAEHGLTADAFYDHSTNVAAHYGTIRERLMEKRSQFRSVLPAQLVSAHY